jgi:hypothetical protein
LYGGENENLFTKYFTGIAGATLESNFSKNTFGKLSAGYSYTYENVLTDSISFVNHVAYRSEESKNITNRYSLAYQLSHKINRRNSVIVGTNNNLMPFNVYDKKIYGGGIYEFVEVNQKNKMTLLQAYAQWKHRFNDNLSLITGLHYQILTLNNSSNLEPRAGLKYSLGNKDALSFGYGLHSLMQSPLVYFYQTQIAGRTYYSNENLGFTKSQHFILGYDHIFGNAVHAKIEAYYQAITNVPVQTKPTGFSLLNDGADFILEQKDSLVNKGTGKNYGIELTIEKYFSHGSYFLCTGSLFNSKYRGSDGVERNTPFNTKYVLNFLAGQDFKIGKQKNTISFNLKTAAVGGKYASPVDVTASENSSQAIYDETAAPYSIKQNPYFRADFKTGYRQDYKKSTLEFGIDFQNFTNHKNVFIQTYNRRTEKVQNEYQQAFLFVPYLRYTF